MDDHRRYSRTNSLCVRCARQHRRSERSLIGYDILRTLAVICIGYNTVWSELCEYDSRQCCNLLISWPVNVGDVFIEAWLLVWLARPICCICRTLCTLTPDKLSAVSYDPLTHSRHNAGNRGVKVVHEISNLRNSRLSRWMWKKPLRCYTALLSHRIQRCCCILMLLMFVLRRNNYDIDVMWTKISNWIDTKILEPYITGLS